MNPWHCSGCRWLNHAASLGCEKCGLERPESTDAIGELIGAARDVCTGHISVDKLLRLRVAVLKLRPGAFGA